jgi:hypothetical protein
MEMNGQLQAPEALPQRISFGLHCTGDGADVTATLGVITRRTISAPVKNRTTKSTVVQPVPTELSWLLERSSSPMWCILNETQGKVMNDWL